MKELSTIGVGNLGLPLRINSPELHHTKRQQDEILGSPHVFISVKENSSNGSWWIRLKTCE